MSVCARVLRQVTLYSNRAACQLKLGETEKCIADATSAVDTDRQATKARFRRAQAYVSR